MEQKLKNDADTRVADRCTEIIESVIRKVNDKASSFHNVPPELVPIAEETFLYANYIR
jgi:hypothetical protein